jgi:hypothetical protein
MWDIDNGSSILFALIMASVPILVAADALGHDAQLAVYRLWTVNGRLITNRQSYDWGRSVLSCFSVFKWCQRFKYVWELYGTWLTQRAQLWLRTKALFVLTFCWKQRMQFINVVYSEKLRAAICVKSSGCLSKGSESSTRKHVGQKGPAFSTIKHVCQKGQHPHW